MRGPTRLRHGEGRRRWLKNPLTMLELLIILVGWVFAIRGLLTSNNPVELAFPLEDGRYYVLQGGSSFLMNYHHPVTAQQYAVDILELNDLGVRAAGF